MLNKSDLPDVSKSNANPTLYPEVTTLIAVNGVFYDAYWLGWVLFLGHTFAWFVLNGRFKLLAYRIFDQMKAPLFTKKLLDLLSLGNADLKVR